MSWLITRVIRHTGIGKYRIVSIITLLFLSVFTSLSWITSELIADVYTSAALLAMFIILTGKEKTGTNIFLYFIYFLSVATHLSHLVIFAPLPVLLLLLRKCFFTHLKYATRSLIALIVLTLASIVIMGNAMSKSSHAFLMGSMLDKGILEKYLHDKCASKSYALCKYKDNLPTDVNVFLWNEDISPLYLEGGWQLAKAEYTAINDDILSSPQYLPYSWLSRWHFQAGSWLVSASGMGINIFRKTLMYTQL